MGALIGVLGVFAGTLILLLLTSEAGYYLGRRQRERSDQEGRYQVSIVEAALLGLLALLLGFTFSMAVARFDERQQLVIREANAVSTVALRSEVLPGEGHAAAVAKLRQYAELRLEFFEAAAEERKIDDASVKLAKVQADLWTLAREEARVRPSAVTLGLMESMNDLFDLSEARRAALENMVPFSVWLVLYLVAGLSSGSLGYGSGLAGRRLTLPIILVPLLMGIILTLLLDLDHPRRGLIRSSQASMLRVRDSLK
jgi:hypothetical protein